MAVLLGWGPQVNKFEDIYTLGSPDITNGGFLHSNAPCLEGRARLPCTVRSHVQREMESWGFLYDEVQCIMGNGHMATPHGQNNIQT